MATPLTGSSVASTYIGLLKTSDNASLTGSLRSISDGGGTDSALQLSTTAANIVGTLNVTGATGLASSLAVSGLATIGSTLGVTGATNLSSTLTVTGATTLSSTLAVTGAANLSSTLAVTSNISTSAGNLSVFGNIVQTNAAASSSFAGSLTASSVTFSSTFTCNGNASFFGNVSFANPLTINSTLNVTGATVISDNLTVTGSIGSSSSISGASLSASGNLTVNGNTTIGNAAADLLTVNANVVTFPNITTQNVDTDTDKVIILDSTGRLRASNSSQFVQTSLNSPQCKQTANKARASIEANTTGSGADVISVSITPRSGSSNILVSAVINYSFLTGDSKNCVFRLTRNGTEIGTSTGTGIVGIASASYEDGEIESINNVKIEFLDSPNTTSAVAYKIHIYGSSDLYLNFNISGSVQQSTTSTITAQEYFA
jgi:hypothetical protein